MIAADVDQTDWFANIPTAIVGLKQLQEGIKTEFKESAAERCRQQIEHTASSKKGGEKSVQARRSALASRNEKIVMKARQLLASKKDPCEICSILASLQEAEGLSIRQVRVILQQAGVLEKRK